MCTANDGWTFPGLCVRRTGVAFIGVARKLSRRPQRTRNLDLEGFRFIFCMSQISQRLVVLASGHVNLTLEDILASSLHIFSADCSEAFG